MAETSTDTAPNGKKPDEETKLDAPVKSSNADDSSAKELDDLKACGIKGSKDEVAAETLTSKCSSDSKAAKVAAKQNPDVESGTVELVEEEPKVSAVLKVDTHSSGDGESDVGDTKGKDGNGSGQAQGGEVKVEMDTDAGASKDESNKTGGEENVAMDIDDTKQEKPEENAKPEVEQKTGVVLNPKKKGKKGGRPRRSNVEAKPEVEHMKTDEVEPTGEKKETKKRTRQRREHPITPLSERDRPARERKSIDRFVAPSLDKGKKEIVIKQGTGTPLMDIPNVAYKLGKRAKGDEILHMLHLLLFNKRGKASVLKYNIYRFSGYVWGENEEKEKNKVKEKLERYTKEGLGQLIDVLDLHLPKTGKKEELVVKVLQFLESPHKTTEVSLGEKEQKLKEKKRKSRGPGRGRGGSTPGKKRRKLEDSTTKRGRGRKRKDESESDGDPSSGEEDLEVEEVEGARLTFKESDEEDDDDDEDYEAKHNPMKRASKSSKNDAMKVHVKVSHDGESEGDQGLKKPSASDFLGMKTPSPDITQSTSKPPDKVYTKGSRKKNKDLKEREMLEKEKEKEKEKAKEKEVPERKRRGKEKEKSKEKNPEKRTMRGARRVKEVIKKKKSGDIPSDEVLQNEIRDLLKDLSPSDFSKVTFMDIVIQLEEKFNVDLSVKKAHVKLLIRQEVSRLAEEATDEEAPADTDAPPEGEDEAQAAVLSLKEKTAPSAAEGDKDGDSEGAEESGDVSGDTAAKDADAGDMSETVEPTKGEEQKDAEKDVEQSQSPSTVEETAEGGAAETD